jgi:hypothetical protein
VLIVHGVQHDWYSWAYEQELESTFQYTSNAELLGLDLPGLWPSAWTTGIVTINEHADY